MSIEELFQQVCLEFRHRKFAAGLAMAFIDFLTDIGATGRQFQSYEDFLTLYPRRERTERGTRANTLIVQLPDGRTKSIRSYYDKVQHLVRSTHYRLDYPSAAPHATQGWVDYKQWIGTMVGMPSEELITLRQRILDFILSSLPSHAIDPATISKAPPVFLCLLKDFDLGAQKGEPTGAAFQDAVFAYLRADAPHLQVEVRKVRTGSKRVGGIGDIDAWDGDRLIISAEAKHYIFPDHEADSLGDFANQVTLRKALGIVVAEDFSPSSRVELELLKLTPLSRAQLTDIVRLWDPLKQRIAAQAFLYYASHVEQSASLVGRIREFFDSLSKSLPSPSP